MKEAFEKLGITEKDIEAMESIEKKEPDAFHRLMNKSGIQMTINEVSKAHIKFRQLLNRAEVI